MWREAVRASSLAMGLADLSTTNFIELSPRAAELMGTTSERGSGLNYLAVAERPAIAAETFRLARDGVIDGIRARRRFRRPDGSEVEVESTGWAIRSPAGPDLGLWGSVDGLPETEDAAGTEEIVTASLSQRAGLQPVAARLTLDDHWRIADIGYIGTNAGLLLGRARGELLASSLIELTHPSDLAALLFGFARATSEPSVSTRVRLRHRDGSWHSTEVGPELLDGDGVHPFTLVVVGDKDPGVPDASDFARLFEQIHRIVAQVGAMSGLAQTLDGAGAPGPGDLTARQCEVVSRLVRGQRVATIAAEMYVSRSTVRNHLSTVFRKVGVHSQQQFLALWHWPPLPSLLARPFEPEATSVRRPARR
jgi:PAS domain S-box-containing protein